MRKIKICKLPKNIKIATAFIRFQFELNALDHYFDELLNTCKLYIKKLYYVYIMIYIERKRFLMEKMMNYTLSTNRVLFLCADQYFFFGEADP